jgi:hypothetical protein
VTGLNEGVNTGSFALCRRRRLAPGALGNSYTRFYNYSFLNQIRLMMEGIAEPVATYNRWQELGRQVRKGSKAKVVLAPALISREAKDANGNVLIGDNGRPRKRQILVGFRVEAVLSLSLLPTPVPPRLSGALNLYARAPHGFDATEKDAILLLATHASLALATTEAVTIAKLREAQLHQAIDSRDVIGQAKGVLMGRRNISAAEAFDILRFTSQNLNVKLSEIAKIVAAQPDILDHSS